MLANIIARLRACNMPSFESQYWNGWGFKLNPAGFIRTFFASIYHYRFIYFNGTNINFELAVGIPYNQKIPETIKFEWDLHDREKKEIVKSGSGLINIFQENSKIRAKSDGKYLYKMIPIDGHRYKEYLGLSKAIKLGYQIDDRKCFIKMKFIVGEQEFNSEPMAVFTIFDKDEFHKASIEVVVAAIIGAIIGFVIGHMLH